MFQLGRLKKLIMIAAVLVLASGWEDCSFKPKSVVAECESYAAPWAAGNGYYCVQGIDNNLISHYGRNKYALDFAMPQGTPLLAAKEGTVHFTRDDQTEACPIAKDCLGNQVVIDHGDGTYAVYHHMLYRGVMVDPGQWMEKGQFIGFSGHTGVSAFPHLHFEINVYDDTDRFDSIPFYMETANQDCTVPSEGEWVKSGLVEVFPEE